MTPPSPGLPQPIAALGPPLRGGDVVRALLVGLGLFALAFYVLRELTGSATAGARINQVIAYFAAWSFAWLGAIWFIFVRGRGLRFADLGYIVPEPRWAVRGVAAAFAAVPAALLLLALLRPILDVDTSGDAQQYFGGPDFTVIQAAAMLLYGGFLVPLAEEFLFRGLIFRWLRQRFDFWPAAFISAAAFGAAHMRADMVVIAGLLGLPLAWLYEKSRSLAPAILMHQTYNSLLLLMTFAVVWMPPGTET